MTADRLGAADFARAWVAVFLGLAVLDALWLGVIAKGLYKRELGDLLRETLRLGPALLFYLLYPVAITHLALLHRPARGLDAMLRAAVLGLAAYGAYNLTNLAIVRNWPFELSMIDWAWGGVVSALAGGSGWRATWGRRS
jgi:uncharacterized membrane protein